MSTLLDRGPGLSRTKFLTLLFLSSLAVGDVRAQVSLHYSKNGSSSLLPLAVPNEEGGGSGIAGETDDESLARLHAEGQKVALAAPVPPNPEMVKARAKMARIHFEKGMQYRQGGDSSRALIEFLKVTREDPKQTDAYYEQALIFREKGFHKLAVSRLEQALAIKPRFQKARLLLATLKLEQGKVSDAVEQLGESLGLPKAASIKPDDEANPDDRILGIPPMILQSLHSKLPLPLVAQNTNKGNRSNGSDRENISTDAAETGSGGELKPAKRIKETKKTTPNKVARKRRPSNRKKIRELIARKYKLKNSKSEQQKNWIARLFAWPETFKAASQDDRVVYADEDTDDLAPRPASDLKKEFREPIEPEEIERRTRAKRTLLAYNGDPSDTMDLVYGKNADKNKSDSDEDEVLARQIDELTGASRSQSASRTSSTREPASKNETDSISRSASTNRTESAGKRESASRTTSATSTDPFASWTHVSKDSSSPRTTAAAKPTRQAPSWNDEEPDGPVYHASARAVAHNNPEPEKAVEKSAPEKPAKKLIAMKPAIKPNPDVEEDEWTKRLRYLAEHGTSSLKRGEAFMFSEDTGEAVLFLADGQRIRRVIAEPLDSQEVIKKRRPDVLIPKELFFNTSLLGKVVGSPPPPVTPAPIVRPMDPTPVISNDDDDERPSSSEDPTAPPSFKIEQIMDNPTGFWNWCKSLINL